MFSQIKTKQNTFFVWVDSTLSFLFTVGSIDIRGPLQAWLQEPLGAFPGLAMIAILFGHDSDIIPGIMPGSVTGELLWSLQILQLSQPLR